MNDLIKEFIAAFIEGAKETPRGYFAPAIGLWRLSRWAFVKWFEFTESVMKGDKPDAK